ncbi:3-oxoacyl-[acyl-carrier protein] reductase [Minicystis rosea]|nr:3-oxoacyl-[acyl-carrier protein] reductase [Minicystis rosea]
MTDLLLHPAARRILGALPLPIPLPQPLRRDASPWTERPLAEKITILGAAGSAEGLGAIAAGILPAGAAPYLAMPDALRTAFRDPQSERAIPSLDALGDARPAALVFDATGLADPASLRALYDFFHPLVKRLDRGGRVVVIARAEDGASPEAAAVGAALEGFVRSLAKEIGRLGATANLVRVARGAEDRLGPVLRFLLSARAAFITAQPITITTEARAAAATPFVRPLAGKIALVTGAARGIGEATTRLLAQEGAHVIALDRPGDDALRAVADAVSGTALAVDLGDAGAPARIAEAVREKGVDIVVHNAGITRDKTLARMSTEQWDAVLDVNLAAAARIHAAIADRIRDDGRVVCLSSVAGLAGNMGQTAYAASKAGIAAWARATAKGLSARGITVNAVAPGFIETRMTAAMPIAIREAARRLSALAQGGQPEDVAQAITFLASPGAHGITGRTLRVCGGAFVGA